MVKTSVKGQTDAIDAAIAAEKAVVDATKIVVDASKVSIDAALVKSAGKGTSLAADKTIIDAIGSDGTTSLKATVDTVKTVADTLATAANLAAAKVIIDAIYATMALPKIARKAYTFSALTTGAVGQHTLFTVTGGVKAKIYAICTTDVTPDVAGATISVGTAAAVDTFCAVTLAADIDISEIWFAAVPATVLDTDANAGGVKQVIGNGADITADILVQAIASGVIEFMCEWEPITADGNVVAA